MSAAQLAAQTAFTLALDEHLPAQGSSVQLALQGAPAGLWFLFGAGAPAEIALGAPGVLYLDPATAFALGAGQLDGTGLGGSSLPIPADSSLVGKSVYLQAAQLSALELLLSNASLLRVESAALAGARGPVALALDPSGARLYALHQDEGVLSIIDAALEQVLLDLPVGPAPESVPFGAFSVAVDPLGAHVFVVNAADDFLTVLDAASGAVTAKVPVPRSSRRVAFDFSAGVQRVYLSNDRDERVLRFEPGAAGTWVETGSFALQGRGAGPLAVAPDGRVLVGMRVSRTLEVLDPLSAVSVANLPLGGVPKDIEMAGARALVATFAPLQPLGQGAPHHQVAVFELATLSFSGSFLTDLGTDYLDLAVAAPYLAVAAEGSGTLLLADLASLAPLAVLDLNPPRVPGAFAPSANPMQVGFALTSGLPTKVFALDYFRETLRSVALGSGAPFTLGAELPLAHSGQVRVPLVDLSTEENGEWWFRSVQFFNCTPLQPNPLTCYTCHPDAGADGLTPQNQRPALWDCGNTGPWGSKGNNSSLLAVIQGAFAAHGQCGGAIPGAADLEILAYLTNGTHVPASPFLAQDGQLTLAQSAGKLVFEGAGQCASCHAAPLFVPLPPKPPTIAAGVGTGLVPANVPSLRGVWLTAPYFKNGSAASLEAVLEFNTGNLHGLSVGLSAQQRADLVEYLKTL